MKIDYLIDGSYVELESITDATKKKAIEVATSFVIERVQDLRDPETGEAIELTVVDVAKEGLSFRVKGSAEIRKQVSDALFPGEEFSDPV